MKSINQLLLQYDCKEIANCPGRYIVKNIPENLSVNELMSENVKVSVHDSPKAKDKVAILILEDGGIISYIRANGTLLHTINNKSGFYRKIQDLELSKTLSDDARKDTVNR